MKDNILWEEKNLIEPTMKLENRPILGQNDGTNEIKNVFVKNECEDTGKRKEWKRNCPKCGKEKVYHNRRHFNRANKDGSVCRSCSKSNLIRSEIHKQNLSKSLKGKSKPDYFKEKCKNRMLNLTPEMRKRLNIPLDKFRGQRKGSITPDDVKCKLRISMINYIQMKKLNGGQMKPNYNYNACQYFDKLNNENGWGLIHAQNGGEFYVRDLGYWVDAYDKNRNIVVEYDELYHRNKLQEKKDLRRLNEIKNHLHCRFFRYKEQTKELIEY